MAVKTKVLTWLIRIKYFKQNKNKETIKNIIKKEEKDIKSTNIKRSQRRETTKMWSLISRSPWPGRCT